MSDKPSIDSIFCSAIEIESPDERRAHVEHACGEDVELRNQLERLLHAHGRSILDAPVRGSIDRTTGNGWQRPLFLRKKCRNFSARNTGKSRDLPSTLVANYFLAAVLCEK